MVAGHVLLSIWNENQLATNLYVGVSEEGEE